jgi:hypothetical protein
MSEPGDLSPGWPSIGICVPEGRLSWIWAATNPPCRMGSRWKLPHAGPHPPHKRNPVKGTTTCPKSAPQLPFVIFASSCANFLGLLLSPRSEFRRPSGTQAPRGPEPGDKSPGYYHLSLRDAFWQAPKATGAKHVPSRRDGRSHCQSHRYLSSN